MLANTFNHAAPANALCLSALLLHEPLTLVKLIPGGIASMRVARMIARKRLHERRQPAAAGQAG